MSDLFEWGEAHARRNDPETSHEAAEHVKGLRATNLEQIALEAFTVEGTAHDLCERTGLPWQTITPRLAPLKRKGLLYDTGKRERGPTGRRCIVWARS